MSSHITLRQFRYFIAVAESGSVAAASRMLNIAQSAVTKSLQELEDELGQPLFARSSRGMTLTPQGHRFLASARKVIGAVAEASRVHQADDSPGLRGTLTSASPAWSPVITSASCFSATGATARR